ncbi:isocitrate lyase/PEP mutase family protein [Roseateles oligotrophus]|uniref:Isocitrate lyase/phosphoenolpyruvate mutase family protein n=1 Tax=Roseateles oligotrophus TaxID=1769250 RepID=A0ABT2Y9M5_9BURK|nr:isocitrate lyase/phosphoenolpyruvate mutase family protein [Roseateles oligotrophus]MCV2367003.1 isocitrate lyase/phosphoenolpyruvate mutase family protein [Roseateles oligotrophus]
MQPTPPRDAAFQALHRLDQPLYLANAWDAGSARLIAQSGAQAIATTSAGIAWSLGYQDGNKLPLDEHLAAVRRIARVIDLPLSVDIEGGYGSNGLEVGDVVARMIDAGAVGINMEDGSTAPEVLCEKIAGARAAAQRLGVRLYINARTDVLARGLVAPARQPAEVLRRAALYRAAGADGLFVLGLVNPDDIAHIAADCGLLLNVIAWQGLPSAAELRRLGVRRVSAGSWLPQQLWQTTRRLVSAFLASGEAGALLDGAAPYAEVNAAYSN